MRTSRHCGKKCNWVQLLWKQFGNVRHILTSCVPPVFALFRLQSMGVIQYEGKNHFTKMSTQALFIITRNWDRFKHSFSNWVMVQLSCGTSMRRDIKQPPKPAFWKQLSYRRDDNSHARMLGSFAFCFFLRQVIHLCVQDDRNDIYGFVGMFCTSIGAVEVGQQCIQGTMVLFLWQMTQYPHTWALSSHVILRICSLASWLDQRELLAQAKENWLTPPGTSAELGRRGWPCSTSCMPKQRKPGYRKRERWNLYSLSPHLLPNQPS